MSGDNLCDDMLSVRTDMMLHVPFWHVQEADVERKCTQLIVFSASAKHSYCLWAMIHCTESREKLVFVNPEMGTRTHVLFAIVHSKALFRTSVNCESFSFISHSLTHIPAQSFHPCVFWRAMKISTKLRVTHTTCLRKSNECVRYVSCIVCSLCRFDAPYPGTWEKIDGAHLATDALISVRSRSIDVSMATDERSDGLRPPSLAPFLGWRRVEAVNYHRWALRRPRAAFATGFRFFSVC